MSEGIDNTLKLIEGVKQAALDAVAIAKGGVTIGDIPKALKLMFDLKSIYDAAPAALPELKDVDGKEAAELSESAYEVFKSVYEAIQAPVA